MNQILMAAARGARIELRHFNEQVWYRAYSIDVNGGSAAIDGTYRIHPDDDHYRFGPISTELRNAAEKVNERTYIQDVLGHYGIAAIDVNQNNFELGYCWDTAMNATALHKSLFLLILSETLAEEGL